jgi:hypothetical protein
VDITVSCYSRLTSIIFQCRHRVTNAVDHYRVLTLPLTREDITSNPWLSASLDFRKQLAPKTQAPKSPKLKRGRKGRGRKRTTQRVPSPEVLPPPPDRSFPRLPLSANPTPHNPLQDWTPAPPLFTRSPSERRDITPTVIISPRSARSTATPNGYAAAHMNASPVTPPSNVSRSTSCDSEVELINFNPHEHSDEIRRRRRAGLPSPRTSADVEMPIRFYLVSRHMSHIGKLLTKLVAGRNV